MEQNPNAIGDARTLHPDDPALHLVGDSAAIEEVRSLIRYAAATTIPVMITGPSGCGKEVVAKALHRCSARSGEKFIGVNCGAIPRDLLESELFGHEKGSFTGAIAQRKGQFEDASNGTLFLDEIGDMPFDMQVKLLRVLEEKQIERIGGAESIAIDTRIISATHQNLDQAIADKRFREDLFYRLSVFPIDIPALKDRRDDIAPLIRHFIAQIGSEEIYFSTEAMDLLENYAWPGNARELRNIVERAVVLFPGVMISASQLSSLFRRRASNAPTHHRYALPSSYAGGAEVKPFKTIDDDSGFDRGTLGDGFDLKKHLMQEERKYLLSALRMAEGVVAEAAHLVSLRRTTFVEKMRRHKIVRKMAMTDHRSELVRRE
ncbi:sigma-54 interaction domain-containing protein [Parasphingorhabdus cellanae]|uniref:Sigma-54-dependent Fis family transcriptional regulator n=1 Tax=Parasphingorhabdus cellanae TaxID=2806553 RepID=A0ABX7T0K3_9SPHN|nr:sigma-54 dependent transcriptional regulator [Parasphingorhabdus cellanae]QTD55066.1 sigma-54-dependent Fis family transcriptional regulator [Parasphingorhabdus cellanae]